MGAAYDQGPELLSENAMQKQSCPLAVCTPSSPHQRVPNSIRPYNREAAFISKARLQGGLPGGEGSCSGKGGPPPCASAGVRMPHAFGSGGSAWCAG